MIDIFSTRQLLGILKTLHAVKTPYLDTFFKRKNNSAAETIDLDFVTGTRKLAPFVSADVQGRMINKKAWERKSIKPPYIKIKDVTSAADLLKTIPGQSAYDPAQAPQALARKALAQSMSDFKDMITRRMEFMAHQSLSTLGDITFTGDGINLTVNFGMKATHKVTLAGTAKWSDLTNSNPANDFNTWANVIKKDSGLMPDQAFLDIDATGYLLENTKLRNQLDTRRVDLGLIKPNDLPNGLRYIATLRRPSIDLFEYNEYYENDSGVVTPIQGSNTVVLGSTRAKTVKHFGAIKDLDAGTFKIDFFAKSWREKDPSAQILLVQSAPLPAPHQIDAFLEATVA